LPFKILMKHEAKPPAYDPFNPTVLPIGYSA
jgi:hypothetical protein